MGAYEAAIAALLIAHSVDIARLEASEREKILALLKQLEKDLAALLSTEVLSDMGKTATKEVLREITTLIQNTYTEVNAISQATLPGLAAVEVKATVQALEQVLNITIGSGSKPTAGYLRTLASDVLIQGSPLKEWWGKQAGDVQFRFAAELRKGAAAGETNQQIIARIVGTKTTSGVMQIARKNAAALVQTSIATVANSARMETFRRNSDIINGVTWSSTLDSHTCEVCGSRDGQSWDLDGAALPGTNMPFVEPPGHVNCRCALISKLKPMSEISGGMLPDIPNNGTRASTGGQVPATTTFADWLNGRSEDQIAEQFGSGRAELFKSGKISLRDMLDLSGNPLTLAELQAKYK